MSEVPLYFCSMEPRVCHRNILGLSGGEGGEGVLCMEWMSVLTVQGCLAHRNSHHP